VIRWAETDHRHCRLCAQATSGQRGRRAAAEFGKLIADETEKWGKVIRAGNIKLD
jgi:hypothetical protein